jgi:hypothetical protein
MFFIFDYEVEFFFVVTLKAPVSAIGVEGNSPGGRVKLAYKGG